MSALRARLTAIAVLGASAILGTSTAWGAARDAEALELAKKAIYGDYLATKFADAEKKLKQALSVCGPADGCSAKVRAQILCELGVVYLGGLNRPEEGKAQFSAALKEDPGVAPEADLLSPEIEAAFAEMKRGGGGAKADPGPAQAEPPAPTPAPPAAAKGDLVHTPPPEQATLTPVPLYAELPPRQSAARVQVSYRPNGASEWKSLELKPLGRGFGAEIPCVEVGGATGDLSYYIQAFDAAQNMVSWSGSRGDPNKVPIRLSLQGDPPHLPGQPPPARCPDTGDCPPEFPGCHTKTEEAPRCEPGAACADLTKPKPRKNWVSLAVQQDFLVLAGSKSTCAGGNEYSCFDDAGTYYDGIPYTRSGDEVRGGVSVATTRILAGYDRVLVAGLALGVRVGYAFRGGPAAPQGRSFFPFHGELRASYWFGPDPFERKGLRPYVVLDGGLAQVDGSVGVALYKTAQDYVSDTRTSLAAYRKSGTGFLGGGVGVLLAPTPRMGPFLELKFMELLGASGSAMNLQLGYALGL